MANHVVKIEIGRKGKFGYTRWHVLAGRGDTIKWKLANDYPYAIVMKASASPFTWMVKAAGKGKWIEGKVRANAAPGCYPYGVGAYNGHGLLFDDPEIIIKPPTRGGKGA